MTVAWTKTFKAAEQGQISKVNEELLETRKTAARSVSKPFGRSFELVWLLMLFQFKTKKIVSFR